MRILAWLFCAWAGCVLWAALSSRLLPGHLVPDPALITVVFLALRREPIGVVAIAASLGALVGASALAPVGVHETALVACALVTYVASAQLSGGGSVYFAAVCCAMSVFYHALLATLLWVGGRPVGFAGWSAMVLLPSGLVTAVVALLSLRPMQRLEAWLTPPRREGLGWH